MKDLKDVERDIRLCEKEIDTLTDQISQRESALRLEVDRLRHDLDALSRYLAHRDPEFETIYRAFARSASREASGRDAG